VVVKKKATQNGNQNAGRLCSSTEWINLQVFCPATIGQNFAFVDHQNLVSPNSKMKIVFILLWMILAFNVNGQLAYPYKVYSENEQYFIKSIPFSDQVWTDIGRTSIHKSKDSINALVSIDRYFSPGYLFMSNNGTSFINFDNWINPSDSDPEVLSYYDSGTLKQIYKLSHFVPEDSIKHGGLLYNFYSNEEGVKYPSINRGNNFFVDNDTLFLLLKNEKVHKFLLSNGKEFADESFERFMNRVAWVNDQRVVEYDIKIPVQFGLPKLANGKEYWQDLESKLDVIFLENENRDAERLYKHYMFELYIYVDSSGRTETLDLKMKHTEFKSDIERYLKSLQFNKAEIPKGIEKWRFYYITGFRKRSEVVAKEERKKEIEEEKIEYQKRILMDSIDHVYIPKDLPDCFRELNIIFSKPKELNEFKTMSEDDIGVYHMGLGRWMRNYWGLWNGSRLSNYFNKLGVKHADNMSGIILRSYHRHLNGKKILLDELLRRYKEN
jgi:hypothetical protein